MTAAAGVCGIVFCEIAFALPRDDMPAAGTHKLMLNRLFRHCFDSFFFRAGRALNIKAVGAIYHCGETLPVFAVIHTALAGVEQFVKDGIDKPGFGVAFVEKHNVDVDRVTAWNRLALSPSVPRSCVDGKVNDVAIFDSDVVQILHAPNGVCQ